MPTTTYNDVNTTYRLDDLLTIKAPPAPADFFQFWESAYQNICDIKPQIQTQDTNEVVNNWSIINIRYSSTNNINIGGWLLIPVNKAPTRAFIVGHGYAGRNAPDFHLPFPDAAIFFPCCRGISRSQQSPISPEPHWHVLHDIDKKDQYILKGCVEDIWLATACIEQLFPYLSGKIGFLGISFTGGIGALAMAHEKRIARAHLNVPTFGHHRFRLRQHTWGSGNAIQEFYRKNPKLTLSTLRYYDAANAAEHITMPMHFALALKDPVVTPPGQFAIFNHTNSDKKLIVLDEGHGSYPEQHQQEKQLADELKDFFSTL